MASVVSSTPPARRRLIRSVRAIHSIHTTITNAMGAIKDIYDILSDMTSKAKMPAFKEEIERIRKSTSELAADNMRLTEEMTELKKHNEKLVSANEQLIAENAKLNGPPLEYPINFKPKKARFRI